MRAEICYLLDVANLQSMNARRGQQLFLNTFILSSRILEYILLKIGVTNNGRKDVLSR